VLTGRRFEGGQQQKTVISEKSVEMDDRQSDEEREDEAIGRWGCLSMGSSEVMAGN